MLRVGCLVFVLALAACGSTPQDRGISGAGIGAAGGAIIGAVTGLSVLEGALIGAGVGGLTGAFTEKDMIDLGDPIWKRGSETAATESDRPSSPDRRLVRDIQSGLADSGYDPGPIDGVVGPMTTDAILQYQGDNDLLTDGQPTVELAQHMEQRAE